MLTIKQISIKTNWKDKRIRHRHLSF